MKYVFKFLVLFILYIFAHLLFFVWNLYPFKKSFKKFSADFLDEFKKW